MQAMLEGKLCIYSFIVYVVMVDHTCKTTHMYNIIIFYCCLFVLIK